MCVCVGGGGGANFMYQTTRSKVSVVKFIIEKKILWSKERWAAVADSGRGGAPGARVPPPFRSSNYIFIVAQYSVFNCILNVQLQKASALRAGWEHISLPYPPPFNETRPFLT